MTRNQEIAVQRARAHAATIAGIASPGATPIQTAPEFAPGHTAAELAPRHTATDLSRRQLVTLVLVATNAGSLLSFAYKYLEQIARGRLPSPVPTLIEELTGGYGGALIMSLLIYIAWRLALPTRRWPAHIAFHLAGIYIFSALHTTSNYLSRIVVYRTLGLGTYDYGILPARYAMEFPKDLTIYVFIFGFLHLFDRYRRARARELHAVQLEARLAHARLHNLQAQLHPHFLFNALNAISSIMYDDVRAADRMLTRLADLLRRALDASRAQVVTLGEELELLEAYLELMRARFGDRLQAEIEVDGDLRGAPVPALLLQPLVENALEHGAPQPPEPARVAIRCRREGGALLLEVQDNGPGLVHPDEPLVGRGVGVTNTVERLRGLYGTAARLSWRGAPGGGLVVSVRLPYEPEPTGTQAHEPGKPVPHYAGRP
jgi:two-component sensor histidine kinase